MRIIYSAASSVIASILYRIDNVVIGGTRQVVDDLDDTPQKEDTEKILESAYRILPSLRVSFSLLLPFRVHIHM